MIDPEIITKEDISNFKRVFDLREFKPEGKSYFLANSILRYGLNITSTDFNCLLNLNKRFCVITGLGVTGKIHLGNKIILDELKYLSSNNVIHLFLSKEDGRSKNIKTADLDYFGAKMINLLPKTNPNIHLHENPLKEHNIILKDIYNKNPSQLFRDVFGEEYTQNTYNAIIDMVAAILSVPTGLEKVVLLGIDEIYNAKFILDVTKLLGQHDIKFIFNAVLVGYDGKKMGKTRDKHSLILSSSYEVEYMKFEKALLRNKDDNKENCVACNIVKYSRIYNDSLHPRECLAEAKSIIQTYCTLFSRD